jgi:hypothetical protein
VFDIGAAPDADAAPDSEAAAPDAAPPDGMASEASGNSAGTEARARRALIAAVRPARAQAVDGYREPPGGLMNSIEAAMLLPR